MKNENQTNTEMTAPMYKKTIFTLVVYTPGVEGWHDRCGDYHYGTESSLSMEYFESKEDGSHEQEIGKRMGYLMFDNSDAELKLLFNGIEPYDEPFEMGKEIEEQTQMQHDAIMSIAYAERDTRSNDHKRKVEEAKKVKEAEELNRRLREKHAQETAERAELLRLKAKYGN